MSPPVTPKTRPDLPWHRLVAASPPIHYPHVVFAIDRLPNGKAMVYAFSEKNGASYARPCDHPDRAARWAVYFAVHHAG